MIEPKVRWEALRSQIIKSINVIDKETPWQEGEPKWWLQMMEIRRMAMQEESK